MSTQEKTPEKLYAARVPIFPKRVKGKFRNLKWYIMAIALGIYYITPWIRWDRGPNLPDQAVLIDLANRRFFFFFIEIWPDEFYYVAGLLIMAGLGLFLFTSALGRVWCGYTCPQTVWTDLFILVERWIEGDRNARIRLHKQKYDLKKLRLRVTKWVTWFLIALFTGGAWVFYFADAPTLLVDLVTGNAYAVAYTTIGILTAFTFIFGGFMREQVCIYMCPWPRIQAAMMDEDTLTVAYRDWRGEPRGKHRKAEGADELGDCIDCEACVSVCPMGIDIRDGQQLECITCALCIDACDDMMAKVGKPRGLIDYMALTDEQAERKGAAPRSIIKHILRPRVLIYTALWAGIGVAMLVVLSMRQTLEMSVAPVRNPTYVLLSDGSIRNTYDLRIRNKEGDDRLVVLSVAEADSEAVSLSLEGTDTTEIILPPDETYQQRVYIIAPKGSERAKDPHSNVTIRVTDPKESITVSVGTVFNGKDK